MHFNLDIVLMSDSECFVTCLETLGMSFSMNDVTSLLCHTAAATRLGQNPRSCWSPKISTPPVPTSQLQSCFQQHLTKLTHASPYTLPAHVLASESCLSVTLFCSIRRLQCFIFQLLQALILSPQAFPISTHSCMVWANLGLHLFLYQGSHISRFNSSLSS